MALTRATRYIVSDRIVGRSRRDFEQAALEFHVKVVIASAKKDLDPEWSAKALTGQKKPSEKESSGGLAERVPELRYDKSATWKPGHKLKLHVTSKDMLRSGSEPNFGWIPGPKQQTDAERRRNMREAYAWKMSQPKATVRDYEVDPNTGERIPDTAKPIQVKGLGRSIRSLVPGGNIGSRAAAAVGIIVDADGKFRCPPGTPAANQFTDEFGSNCYVPPKAARRALGRLNAWYNNHTAWGRYLDMLEADEDDPRFAANRRAMEAALEMRASQEVFDQKIIDREMAIEGLRLSVGSSDNTHLNEDLWHLFKALNEQGLWDVEFRGLFTGVFGDQVWDDSLSVSQNLQNLDNKLRDEYNDILSGNSKTPEMVDILVDRHHTSLRGYMEAILHEFSDDPESTKLVKEIKFLEYDPSNHPSLEDYWKVEAEVVPILKPGSNSLNVQMKLNIARQVLNPILEMEGAISYEPDVGRVRIVSADGIEQEGQAWQAIQQLMHNEMDLERWRNQYASDLSKARHDSFKAQSLHTGYHEMGHIQQYAAMQKAYLDQYEATGQVKFIGFDGALTILDTPPTQWTSEHWAGMIDTLAQDMLPQERPSGFPPRGITAFEGSMLHILSGKYYQDKVQEFWHGRDPKTRPFEGPLEPTANATLTVMLLEGMTELRALTKMGVLDSEEIDQMLDWMNGSSELGKPRGFGLPLKPWNPPPRRPLPLHLPDYDIPKNSPQGLNPSAPPGTKPLRPGSGLDAINIPKGVNPLTGEIDTTTWGAIGEHLVRLSQGFDDPTEGVNLRKAASKIWGDDTEYRSWSNETIDARYAELKELVDNFELGLFDKEKWAQFYVAIHALQAIARENSKRIKDGERTGKPGRLMVNLPWGLGRRAQTDRNGRLLNLFGAEWDNYAVYEIAKLYILDDIWENHTRTQDWRRGTADNRHRNNRWTDPKNKGFKNLWGKVSDDETIPGYPEKENPRRHGGLRDDSLIQPLRGPGSGRVPGRPPLRRDSRHLPFMGNRNGVEQRAADSYWQTGGTKWSDAVDPDGDWDDDEDTFKDLTGEVLPLLDILDNETMDEPITVVVTETDPTETTKGQYTQLGLFSRRKFTTAREAEGRDQWREDLTLIKIPQGMAAARIADKTYVLPPGEFEVKEVDDLGNTILVPYSQNDKTDFARALLEKIDSSPTPSTVEQMRRREKVRRLLQAQISEPPVVQASPFSPNHAQRARMIAFKSARDKVFQNAKITPFSPDSKTRDTSRDINVADRSAQIANMFANGQADVGFKLPNGETIAVTPEVAKFVKTLNGSQIETAAHDAAAVWHDGLDKRPRIRVSNSEIMEMLSTGADHQTFPQVGKRALTNWGYDGSQPLPPEALPMVGHLTHGSHENIIAELLDSSKDKYPARRRSDFYSHDGDTPHGSGLAAYGEIDVVLRPEASMRTAYNVGSVFDASDLVLMNERSKRIIGANMMSSRRGDPDSLLMTHNLLHAAATNDFSGIQKYQQLTSAEAIAARAKNSYGAADMTIEAAIAGGVDLQEVERIDVPVEMLDWQSSALTPDDLGLRDGLGLRYMRSAGWSEEEIQYLERLLLRGDFAQVKSATLMRQHRAAVADRGRFAAAGLSVRYTNPDGIDLFSKGDLTVGTLSGTRIGRTTDVMDALRIQLADEVGAKNAMLRPVIQSRMKTQPLDSAPIRVQQPAGSSSGTGLRSMRFGGRKPLSKPAVYSSAVKQVDDLSDLGVDGPERQSRLAAADPRIVFSDPDFDVNSGRTRVGALLIDEDTGQVMMRHVTGNFGGYGWTIAKGGIDRGETAYEAAMRELHEETGFPLSELTIIDALPHSYGYGSNRNYFYIAKIKNGKRLIDLEAIKTNDDGIRETDGIVFVDPNKALRLIDRDTQNEQGRIRDRTIMAALDDWARNGGGYPGYEGRFAMAARLADPTIRTEKIPKEKPPKKKKRKRVFIDGHNYTVAVD